jgi:uncharacterized protein with HEPN domain
MYDKKLVQQILRQTVNAADTILQRFEPVDTVSYFTDSPYGMEKLDSICMLLIAIGESLKNIDKITGGALLAAYPEINWKGAKAMRDIIRHQYFNIDAEIIFNVCDTDIENLKETLQKIVADL